MQVINIKDYNPSLGPLIDVEDVSFYKIKHHFQNTEQHTGRYRKQKK